MYSIVISGKGTDITVASIPLSFKALYIFSESSITDDSPAGMSKYTPSIVILHFPVTLVLSNHPSDKSVLLNSFFSSLSNDGSVTFPCPSTNEE